MIKPATVTGGSGSVSVGAFGSSPDAKGASASGSTITMQPADATHPGLVSTGAQSFGGAKTFAGGALTTTLSASGLITSTVASGSNFLKPSAGARLSLGSDSRYFSDDGSANLMVTGNFIPSATVSYDFGDSGHVWGTAYVYAVTLASGQIRDSSSTQRIVVNDSAGSVYLGEAAAGGVGHSFDNTTAHTGSGKPVQIKSGGNEKAFFNLDGELELTTVSKGIILQSADGTRYRLIIANGGTVSISAA